MLTLPELQASEINADVAREAYIQVDRHLSDLLEVKKSFEQKSTTLLGAYLTLSIALFGIGGAIFKDSGIGPKVWPFFCGGLILIAGVCCFVAALKTGKYPALGSTPEMWLNSGTIDGGANALSAMLAYITFHHSARIELCERSNSTKARFIGAGIAAGPIAALSFLALLLVL